MSNRRSNTVGKSEGGATGGMAVERKVEGGKSDQLSGGTAGARNQNKHEKEVCPVCGVKVSNSDKALECNLCHVWHHIACENVSEVVYKFLMETKESAVHWYCSKCKNVVVKVVKQMSMISKQQDETEMTE